MGTKATEVDLYYGVAVDGGRQYEVLALLEISPCRHTYWREPPTKIPAGTELPGGILEVVYNMIYRNACPMRTVSLDYIGELNDLATHLKAERFADKFLEACEPPKPVEAIKYDSSKPRMELLPFEALEEVARALAFGAEKYGDHNWRGGMQWSRLVAALLRHVSAFVKGEDRDSESGLSHLAHAACCTLFLLSYVITSKGTDDRYKGENKND